MSPKHVLHVLNGADGGAALSTTSLMTALAARGVASSAVCHDAGSPEARRRLEDATEGRVVFTNLFWWNRKTRSALWKRPIHAALQAARTGMAAGSTARVVAAARRFGVDLIHTNTILTPEGGFAAAVLGLPHVWHVRELVGAGKPFRFWGEGAVFGSAVSTLASAIVANSQASAAALQPWLREGRVVDVVENGIEVERFAAVSGLRTMPVVAMVASVTSRMKKHALFIDALAKVNPELAFDARIYGHVPNSSDEYLRGLEARIARSGRSIRFGGYVDDAAAIMREIDVLVHPADGESFGRIAVEAMAGGVPVVGVAAGGIGAVVEHDVTGLLTGIDDATGLARHIERLLREPELRSRLGEAGRRRAAERFSLDAHAERMLEVYMRAQRSMRGLTERPRAVEHAR